MPDARTITLDLGYGQAAEVTCQVSGVGNGRRTVVTTDLERLSRKMRIERQGSSLVIETEGEWEADSMATLLRGLADALG
jgi:hypothetical protein